MGINNTNNRGRNRKALKHTDRSINTRGERKKFTPISEKTHLIIVFANTVMTMRRCR